jgi:hypothetical protein
MLALEVVVLHKEPLILGCQNHHLSLPSKILLQMKTLFIVIVSKILISDKVNYAKFCCK